jgi:hypothetical protein
VQVVTSFSILADMVELTEKAESVANLEKAER